MKILPVHSNHFVLKEKFNHVNSVSNSSKRYAADTVSFGAKQYTLGENKHIGNVSTRLYIGKKNSIADYVEAKAVVLEEGARIKHLKLNEATFLYPPEFSNELNQYSIKKPFSDERINPQIIMFDGSQIDKLDNRRENTVNTLVWKNKCQR